MEPSFGTVGGSSFSDKVIHEQTIKRCSKQATMLACKQCSKSFPLQWKLNRHSKQCRRASSSHVKVKADGWFPCNICPNKESSSFLLKNHVFLQHTEAQVQATYNRSMVSFLGSSAIDKLRRNVLTVIK